MKIESITINQCLQHFDIRRQFIQKIVDHLDDPTIIEAIKADGVNLNDGLFVNPDEVYCKCNTAGSRTRDYLILKSIK